MDAIKTLIWRQKGVFGREIEIFFGSTLYGQLKIFSHLSARWFKAEAQAADRQWVFIQEKAKFFSLKRRILIKEADGKNEVAIFNYKLSLKFKKEGRLEFLNGRSFIFKINYWSSDSFLTVLDAEQNELLVFKYKVIKWRLKYPNQGEIKISSLAESLSELPILVLFGRYLEGFMRLPADVY